MVQRLLAVAILTAALSSAAVLHAADAPFDVLVNTERRAGM
jgi:hypothetical protein